MNHGKRLMFVATAAALVVAACGSSKSTKAGDTASTKAASTATTKAGDTATTAAAGGTAAADGSGASLLNGEIKCTQQYKGKEVHIFSPVRDSDNDTPVKDYVAGYAPLEKCTGVKIVWEGTDQFETQIKVRFDGGNAPDVIDWPQPGGMGVLARAGKLPVLPDGIAKHVSGDYAAGWAGFSTVDSKLYGVPVRGNVKSLVWYSPADFKAKGYAIPTTLTELTALSDKIAAGGGTPWCAGIESGTATGWVVTDWFEDFMLRINTPEDYDNWVSHKLTFSDPKVKAAADAVAGFIKNPKYIGGDSAVKAIATTKFQDGGLPILDKKCYMHKQASFYSGLWPKGTTIGPDGAINWFFLPMAKATDKKTLLVAGDIYSAGTNKPESMDVLLYSGSKDYADYSNKVRKDLSPRKDFDVASISDPVLKSFAELLQKAEVSRFDGADQMPTAVGSGSFWKEATSWIVGTDSTDQMLKAIDDSWPKS